METSQIKEQKKEPKSDAEMIEMMAKSIQSMQMQSLIFPILVEHLLPKIKEKNPELFWTTKAKVQDFSNELEEMGRNFKSALLKLAD